ncbi:uncharacterized mitochondrial protein AtMg00810-like [Andrographis paniculata]|uniref:uncharacterized mitochondrial protein AtMg00810-like n=1 Tax=Andrographis paniculata TaxID=175694 RepID=UPI0021E7D134|nr:uncharacterized mitochondrial protein AtMg00810-like [Andrographis paniculata]
MKSLGQLRYFLGIEISDAPDGIYLSQAKYANDLISRSGLTDSQIASTPLEGNFRLALFDSTPLEDPSRYRQLVGSLIYLTVTRLYIAHVVHVVAQFMTNPRPVHYVVVLHVFRYVNGTLLHGLYFSTDYPLVLAGFSNTDWPGDSTDRRSITESEYRALADSTPELLWLHRLLYDLRVPYPFSTSFHCDSTSAI